MIVNYGLFDVIDNQALCESNRETSSTQDGGAREIQSRKLLVLVSIFKKNTLFLEFLESF